MTQCQACGAIYSSVQADGLTYFHRCAPLSAVELAAAVKAGKLSLPVGETADDAVAKRTYERAQLRDENLPSTREKDAGKMKAAGVGALTVSDPPASSVVIVT